MNKISVGNFELEEISEGFWRVAKFVGFISNAVVIPANVEGYSIKAVGKRAFEEDKSIENVVIEEGIEVIEDYAFYKCENLKAIRFPRTLKIIGASAFEFCKSLVLISLPINLESIGESAFAWSGIASLSLPNSVKTIGKKMCLYCENLSVIVLSEGLAEIPESAFKDCKWVKKISIPGSVKKIGESAFYSCKNLKKIELNDGLEVIGKNAFISTEAKPLFIPASVTHVESGALQTCWRPQIFFEKGCRATLEDEVFDSCSDSISFDIKEAQAIYVPKDMTIRDECFARHSVPKQLVVYCEPDSQVLSWARTHNLKCLPYPNTSKTKPSFLQTIIDKIRSIFG